jgi:hypothetical protein
VRSKAAVLVLAGAVLAAACSGSPTVADVNGVTITADDVTALSSQSSDDVVIVGEPFRRLLSLLISNVALRTAATEQFGFDHLDDADRIAERIASPPPDEQSVFGGIADNPALSMAYAEGAAEYFIVREAVMAELATADLDEIEIRALFDRWATAAITAADVVVASQIGRWDGNGTVLPPP